MNKQQHTKTNDESSRELTDDEQHIADLLSNAAAKLGMDVKTTPLDGGSRADGLNRLRGVLRSLEITKGKQNGDT